MVKMQEENRTEQEGNRDDKGRFVPGVSGNPNGRPKDEDSPTYWLGRFLSRVDPKSKEGRRRIEDIAIMLAVAANKGESWAIKEIFDRLDGKAPQTVKHEGGVDVNIKKLEEIVDDLLNDSSTKT